MDSDGEGEGEDERKGKRNGKGKGDRWDCVRVLHCLHELLWVPGCDGDVDHEAGGHRSSARRVGEVAELERPCC